MEKIRALLRHLLELGADPNYRFQPVDDTPWDKLLKIIEKTKKGSPMQPGYLSAEHRLAIMNMVKYGADWKGRSVRRAKPEEYVNMYGNKMTTGYYRLFTKELVNELEHIMVIKKKRNGDWFKFWKM